MGATRRTVMVTGANGGIGLATVLDLAANGFRVVGTVRSAAKARDVASAAADAGVEVETVVLDIDDAAACARVVGEIRPDVVVNNAGFSLFAPVEEVDDDRARAALETMVVAPMRLARLALPHMREQRWGRIVNVSSLVGRVSWPMMGWYSAAKHALEAVSDALRVEVQSSGVAVVLIEPGTIRGGLSEELEADAARHPDPRYQPAYERMRSQFRLAGRAGSDANAVATSIRRAITAGRPRARYVVGRDAQLMIHGTALLPTALRDTMSRHGYGL